MVIFVVLVMAFGGYVVGFKWFFSLFLILVCIFAFSFIFTHTYESLVNAMDRNNDGDFGSRFWAIVFLIGPFGILTAVVGWKLNQFYKAITPFLNYALGCVFGGVIGFCCLKLLGVLASSGIAIVFDVAVVANHLYVREPNNSRDKHTLHQLDEMHDEMYDENITPINRGDKDEIL